MIYGRAKRSVIVGIREAGLKMNDSKILGLSDLLDQIKEKKSLPLLMDSNSNLKMAGQDRSSSRLLRNRFLEQRLLLQN